MKNTLTKHFGGSIVFSIICLLGAGVWAVHSAPPDGNLFSIIATALFTTFVLAMMEVSLSFDNAVVNASVLKGWNAFWTRIFLTIGILIAVFGMRLVFPILIVSLTAHLGFVEVAHLALSEPVVYSQKLVAHHAEVASFGGVFLMMVWLNFFFDPSKKVHWLTWVERPMNRLSSVSGISVFVSLGALLVADKWLTGTENASPVLISGVFGLVTYLGVHVLSGILESSNSDEVNSSGEIVSSVAKGGIGGFLYLEVLDASFSFDGVIGAFAITNDVVIIMLGLAIGAMFVRSITIFLVEKGTLSTYRFLEHGAHWAIGALAIIMLLTIKFHIPEVVTGLIGVVFIGVSLWSSSRYNRLAVAE